MSRYYPVILWVVGFGIVLRYALVDFALFNPAYLSDAAREFIVYSAYVETGKWQILWGHELLSSCLFTTYFPALFQRAFDTDLLMTYKLFPVFIISALPVVVYYLARKMLAPFYAFLASSFFVVQLYYLSISAAARVGIAQVFLGLAVLVIFKENLRLRIRVPLLVVLAVCVVLSHYGSTWVALFTLASTCLGLFILWAGKVYTFRFLKAMAIFTVVLMVTTVLWHGWINKGEVIEYGGRMVEGVAGLELPRDRGDDYFALEAREGVIQVALGRSFFDMNPVLKTEFIFSWLTVALMSWGLIVTARRWGLGNELTILLGACYFTILVAIIAPTIGVKYGVSRVYFQELVLLAGCFVVGGEDIAKRLKIPRLVFLLFVLIPYGLCTSGLLHSWVGVSRYPELLVK